MKRKKLILGSLVIVLILALLGYNYVFNPSHRNIANEKAVTSMDALALQKEFQENETRANTRYLDQTIVIEGTVTAIQNNEITLDDSVLIHFDSEKNEPLPIGVTTTVKGRCLGFDELLELVKIDQAITQTKNQTP